MFPVSQANQKIGITEIENKPQNHHHQVFLTSQSHTGSIMNHGVTRSKQTSTHIALIGPKAHSKVIRIQPVNMAQSSDKVSFDNLAERLRTLSIQEEDTESLETIMKMTFDELKGEKIDFGKAHMGRTYLEMLPETKYLTWFAKTFQHSRNPKHVKFLHFVAASREQVGGSRPRQSSRKSVAKPTAKSLAVPTTAPEIEEMPYPEDEDFENWEAINQTDHGNLELLQMQDRMQQMESLLHQVVEHLRARVRTARHHRA